MPVAGGEQIGKRDTRGALCSECHKNLQVQNFISTVKRWAKPLPIVVVRRCYYGAVAILQSLLLGTIDVTGVVKGICWTMVWWSFSSRRLANCATISSDRNLCSERGAKTPTRPTPRGAVAFARATRSRWPIPKSCARPPACVSLPGVLPLRPLCLVVKGPIDLCPNHSIVATDSLRVRWHGSSPRR